jgi:hypothetical protein
VMFFLIAAGSLYAHDLRTCSEKAKLAQTRASGAAVATAAQALQERRVTWRAWVVLRKPPTLVKPHTETVGGCSGVTCPLDFACRTRSAPRALPMALITPLHAAAPVRIAQPGTGHLRRLRARHRLRMPALQRGALLHARLPRAFPRLACTRMRNTLLQGSRAPALASARPARLPAQRAPARRLPLLLRRAVDPTAAQPKPWSDAAAAPGRARELAGVLAQLVTSHRDEHGYLKIGDVSYIQGMAPTRSSTPSWTQGSRCVSPACSRGRVLVVLGMIVSAACSMPLTTARAWPRSCAMQRLRAPRSSSGCKRGRRYRALSAR